MGIHLQIYLAMWFCECIPVLVAQGLGTEKEKILQPVNGDANDGIDEKGQSSPTKYFSVV